MTKILITGKKMRIITILILSTFILSITSCASYDFSRRVVQQGNLLPDAKFEKLKIGMSKEAAATLMGTSLIGPVFSNDRWDYAYTIRKGSMPMKVRNLTLYFANDHLVRIEHHP